jgi:hypothetical protein
MITALPYFGDRKLHVIDTPFPWLKEGVVLPKHPRSNYPDLSRYRYNPFLEGNTAFDKVFKVFAEACYIHSVVCFLTYSQGAFCDSDAIKLAIGPSAVGKVCLQEAMFITLLMWWPFVDDVAPPTC